jgi:protein tyrosine phosphatase (PTP) superfamily phosphohydrolase (DUF442 family)
MSDDTLPANISQAASPVRRPQRWQRRAAIVLACLLAICALLWYVGVFGGNVRTVIPGKLYRSAQLTGSNLNTVLDNDHIRTVLNLRGGSEKDAWYRSESASCQSRGITKVDVPISARKFPPPDRLRAILHTFDTAAYPLLIHCQAGADRTGLATTLYLHLYEHLPLDEAQTRGQTRAMDDFLDLYRKESGGLGLREWIDKRYPALYDALPPLSKGDSSDIVSTVPGAKK